MATEARSTHQSVPENTTGTVAGRLNMSHVTPKVESRLLIRALFLLRPPASGEEIASARQPQAAEAPQRRKQVVLGHS